jgi:TNF receptor-associated factor 4
VVLCKYKSIGCGAKLKRKEMAAHEQDDQLHLRMALETVNSLQVTVNLLRPKIFVLSKYQKKREDNKEFQFPPFYTHPNGYHMALAVDANGYDDGKGTHVSVYAPLLEGEHDAELKWPFIGEVTVTLLNQLEDKNHHTKTLSLDATRNARVGSTWGFPTFIRHSAPAHDPVKNTQYLKDDTLYFRVSVKVADHKPWLEM